jgi:hypothetical protein
VNPFKPTFRHANKPTVEDESDEVDDLKPSSSPMKVEPAEEKVEDEA